MLGMSFVVGRSTGEVPIPAAFIYFFYALPEILYLFYARRQEHCFGCSVEGGFRDPSLLDVKERSRDTTLLTLGDLFP
jgi:hypothetical protein